MNCKTLVIGSGYSSLGYAMSHDDTLIAEALELTDVSFGAPLRLFESDSVPAPDAPSRALYDYYLSLGVIEGNKINASALECGFSGFALDNGVRIMLKSRVISVEEECGGYCCRVITNSGIITVRAERVIDMRPSGDRFMTFLFTASDDAALCAIADAFPRGRVVPAFYEGRYALILPVGSADEISSLKAQVYSRWGEVSSGAKLLYTAPYSFCVGSGGSLPLDSAYTDPFSAYDAGYLYETEGER